MDKNYTPEQILIIKAYIKTTKLLNNHPSRNQMKENGYSKDKIEYHFGSLTALRKAAKDFDPKAFNNIIDEEMFNPKKFAELKEHIRGYNKFVITTAVTGCCVHEGFYNTLKHYCKANNAKLLIIPSSDPAHTRDKNKWSLSHKLNGEDIIFQDVALNDNLWISTIKMSAKQILPLTGLNRFAKNSSCILASPKQHLKMIPTSNAKLPKALMTTGAITVPDYTTDYYFSERTASLAKEDHIIGGIIIELEDDEFFHFRQIQADINGNFYDLDKHYSPTKIEKSNIEIFIPGDYHCVETDPNIKRLWLDLIKELKPAKLVIHDILTSLSINPHNINKSVSLAQKEKLNLLSLDKELETVSKELNDLQENVEQVIIVKSNHDEFLERFLESGRYIVDPKNLYISLKLAIAMYDGLNPLEWSMNNLYNIKNPQKYRWLKRDEDYKFRGIQLGSHGDIGPSGTKATPVSIEGCYANCVIGHFHSPQIIRNTWVTGTSTFLRLDYNRGPSNWVNSGIIIHKNGQKQLLNIINSKWKI